MDATAACAEHFRTALTKRDSYTLDDELLMADWWSVNEAILADPKDLALKARAEDLLQRMCDRIDEVCAHQWEAECEEFGCHDEAQADGSKCGPVDRQSPADPHIQGFDDTTT